MQKYVFALISLFAIAGFVVIAMRSIRRKNAAQSADLELGSLKDLTALEGKPVVAARGQYVATVFYDRPLDRVVTGGLMHRGKAQLVVTDSGIGIERVGEESFAIDAKQLVAINRASSTIDRGVEADGLLAISWKLGETSVTTHLRIDGAEDTTELANALGYLVTKEGAR